MFRPSLYKVTQKKRELLKCVVAAMYSWQHCGTGTLSYRLSLKRQVVMVQFLSIKFFCWISSIFVGFFKSSRFFVSPCTSFQIIFVEITFYLNY
jgi:hypothetical protein